MAQGRLNRPPSSLIARLLLAGRFLCARASKCRRGYAGASLCAENGSELRVLASGSRATPRRGGVSWPFAPNGFSRAVKARGPRSASAQAWSGTWPEGGFGAVGCLPGRALWAFGLRPRRCAAHFPPSGHVILAPVAGLAGRASQSPSCRTPGAPLPPKLRGPNRQTAPRARLGVARRRKACSPRDTMTAENR